MATPLSNISSHSSESEPEHDNRLWEHGDDNSLSTNSSSSIVLDTSFTSEAVHSPGSSQPPTPGITSPMTSMELSSQVSEIFFPQSSNTPGPPRKVGRPLKQSKFRGNRFTIRSLNTSLDDSTSLDTSIIRSTSRHKSKRIMYKIPRCGYTSKISAPFVPRKRDVQFNSNTDTKILKASTPSGMRLLDIGILAEAMTKIRCTLCPGYLSLFESDFLHGWQTDFYLKCSRCQHLIAEFPSSKPMDVPNRTQFVNVPLPKRELNEVTMRSILAVHCSGLSWRDLHKFATSFDMPPPLEHMPPKYLNKIEDTVKIAAEASMQGAADELHLRVDAIPSPIPSCINTAVSFDSSWKTRGFYSNMGFGSAISATTKKVLDYVLLNRTCEKCNRWSAERQNDTPEEYQKWYDTHKPNCFKNYSGSSQSMEPEAAKMIWSRSTEKRKLCYTTFIGDGDSKSYTQVSQMKPYDTLPIHKEECKSHVSKRVKKTLCKIKRNTAKKSYVQCKLSEPKAEYISSNYSTVIVQHRGKSPAEMSKGLYIFLDHVCGDHSNCPEDTWCRWRQTSASAKPPPASKTNYTSDEQAKVREVFQTYASEEFCSHLTLGLTQNANESLHNLIWNFCPKAKYVSPQSVRISTAIAVSIFNEGELCLYGFMRDLNLNPSTVSFRSVCQREKVKKQHRNYIKKANVHRRARRQKLSKLRREKELLKLEGGHSYKSSTYGAETFTKPSKPRRARGRCGPRRSTTSRTTTSRGKGVKRLKIPQTESDDSEPSISESDSSQTDNERDSIPKETCVICQLTHPPSQRHQAISIWSRVKFLRCTKCGRSFHQRCTELDRGAEVSSFICFSCSTSFIL